MLVDGRFRPVHNAARLAIHVTVEGVRNFWRWFGNSATVDTKGRPQGGYHGTTQDFDAFVTRRPTANYSFLRAHVSS